MIDAAGTNRNSKNTRFPGTRAHPEIDAVKSNEKSFLRQVFPLDWFPLCSSIYNESTDNPMTRLQKNLSSPEAVNLLGDFHSLLDEIGAPSLPGEVPAYPDPASITSAGQLLEFLKSYRQTILAPVELPAIAESAICASRNQLRELLALDRRLQSEARLKNFARVSARVAGRHLENFRALRDQRLLQRYRAAIESGAAHGWHMLVYGVILGIYSIPLRQGLVHYARHTQHAFIDSAVRRLKLSPEVAAAMGEAALENLSPMIESALALTEAPVQPARS